MERFALAAGHPTGPDGGRSSRRLGCHFEEVHAGLENEEVHLWVQAICEVTVLIKVVVERGVNGGELLQGLEVPKPGHRPLVVGTVGVSFRPGH
jgi:hypothetical protein